MEASCRYATPLTRRQVAGHVALLLATLITLLLAGAIVHSDHPMSEWRKVLARPPAWLDGLPYALSLLSILLAHEMGHYLACRRYGIAASLPFFLPGPPILGTFGAFIRIRSRIPDRNALFDVGIAGPLAGFLVAIPFLLYGMGESRIVPAAEAPPADLALGFPLLFHLAVPAFFPHLREGSVLLLSPYLTAAWVGMLATSLNLLPAGQLDGGHLCYALSRRTHARMSRLTVIAVILLGALHPAWLLWAVALFLLGDRHPSLVDESTPITGGRRLLALLAALILLLSFIPVPIEVSGL
jgi:membrane-associated protease RseP (regulator of RpoE activity)